MSPLFIVTEKKPLWVPSGEEDERAPGNVQSDKNKQLPQLLPRDGSTKRSVYGAPETCALDFQQKVAFLRETASSQEKGTGRHKDVEWRRVKKSERGPALCGCGAPRRPGSSPGRPSPGPGRLAQAEGSPCASRAACALCVLPTLRLTPA